MLKSTNAITALCLIAFSSLCACGAPDADATTVDKAPLPAERGADSVLTPISNVLLGSAGDSAGLLVGGAARGGNLFVVDAGRSEMRQYASKSGAYKATSARPGSGEGALRQPALVVAGDSGQFIIYDARRNVASFRSATGELVRDVSLPRGYYGGFAVLPAERKLLLSGQLENGNESAKGHDVHEFDFDGNYVRSFGEPAKAKSDWALRFSAVNLATSPTTIVSGAMNASRLRLLDRASERQTWIEVAPGWNRIEWPNDRMLGGADRSVIARRVRDFGRTHRLMTGVFILGEGRLLARFRSFDKDGYESYNYVVTDRSGKTLAITGPTPMRVISASSDTVSWVINGRESRFGQSVVHPAR
jgi:hypothetical protein